MSNVEWDSKTVIGQKAKAPKVTKNSGDLNGTSDIITVLQLSKLISPPVFPLRSGGFP